MVKYCSAVNCNNQATRNCNVSFHQIPSDQRRRRQWLLRINRVDPITKKLWDPTSKFACICSDHFLDEDFYFSKHAGYKLLKPTAVPSKFSHTVPHNLRETNTSLKAVSSTVTVEIEQMEEERRVEKEKVVCDFIKREHDYCIATSEVNLKRKYEEIRERLEATQSELQLAKRREKRSKDTTTKLISELKEQRKLSEQATEMLENFKDIPIDLFKKPTTEYSQDQRLFASTLYFYGPKAYTYVREKLHLPHPSTIQSYQFLLFRSYVNDAFTTLLQVY